MLNNTVQYPTPWRRVETDEQEIHIRLVHVDQRVDRLIVRMAESTFSTIGVVSVVEFPISEGQLLGGSVVRSEHFTDSYTAHLAGVLLNYEDVCDYRQPEWTGA